MDDIMIKAVFYDRDGVINELVRRNGGYYSPQDVSDFRLCDSAIQITNLSKSRGYLNIVVSNQPDVSRGLLSESELDQMTEVLADNLIIDDVLYCLHDDGMCDCRKPLPGMIFKAQKKWDIDLSKSIMVGDTWKDYEAAMNAKVKFVLLEKPYNIDCESVNRVSKLIEIVNYL